MMRLYFTMKTCAFLYEINLVNSPLHQYLRFAALGLGVFYGAYRQQSLTDFVIARNLTEEKKHYKELVEEALVAYEAEQNRQEGIAAAKDGGKFTLTL